MGRLPRPILKVLFNSMTKSPDWDDNKNLLSELPEEIRASAQFNSCVERYQQITAETLVIKGTKTPAYILSDAIELESVLSNGQRLSLKGLDHSAPDERAPEKVAHVLNLFF